MGVPYLRYNIVYTKTLVELFRPLLVFSFSLGCLEGLESQLRVVELGLSKALGLRANLGFRFGA